MAWNRRYPPVIVYVHDKLYNVYGEDTPRTRFLMGEIEAHGGINPDVPEGFYHFNILPYSNGNVIVELKPFDDSSN